MSAITAKAEVGDLIEIQSYDVDMTIRTDRKVEVKERIAVKFLSSGLTMFYRSLPKEGCKYADISASCEGNEAFSYHVADNPDLEGFIDVNCVGNAQRGKAWTYDISYTMEQGVDAGEGMIIDVIGFGWSVPLHNVSVTVHFPSSVEDYKLYVGGYGAAADNAKVSRALSEDKKTLTLSASELEIVYNSAYEEEMAEGITLDFSFTEKGVLQDYASTRLWTEDLWKLLLGGALCIVLSVAVLLLTRKKREIITVVNIKAPDDMDPMQMGKILDGTTDNEDVTSMIYYFADKGYLKIDFTDEEDPTLIRLVSRLPQSASAHEKTLFKGLFAAGKTVEKDTPFSEEYPSSCKIVKVSELVTKFYEASETAKRQVPSPRPMYETKSVFGYLFGGVIGLIFAFLGGYLMGRKLGGGYVYALGILFGIPILVNVLLGWMGENYRFKWKKGARLAIILVEWIVSLLFTLIFVGLFADHLMTGWEKLALSVGALLPAFITQSALSRTEKYVNVLGEILGFKDFIVVTEEEKIKFMLEENPELYYKILPYAQVLGVTDEWEKKFEKITMQPPTWYVGTRMTVFDYLLINRCMRASMMRAMAEAAKKASGGGHIGMSGGGGGFGGFGGGGFGGGGGGAR